MEIIYKSKIINATKKRNIYDKFKYKMILHRANLNYLLVLLLIIYAFVINWVSANIGILPIDTFAFFDSGFNILNNKLPLRDFWIFTGLLVDYLQALFFLIFGSTWNSYVLHASFINILASLSFYFFLIRLNLEKLYSFIYAISFATLCYPLSGTPFAYLHSYIFSLISIFIFSIAIHERKNSLWLLLPIIFFLAFFSMQTPSFYIILILLFFSFYFLIIKKNPTGLKLFMTGGILSLFGVFVFLYLTNTSLENLLYQYFLFPLTIGAGRLTSDPNAYVTLADQINFQRLIGNFKFIHAFLFPLIFVTCKFFIEKKKDSIVTINTIIILSVMAFFFNQLITANQIFIFSLIPIMASLLHISLKKLKISNIIYFVLIFILLSFSTVKFHQRYNIDRKFLDIEELDKNKAIDARVIDEKLKNLKWISKYSEPQEEINLIIKAIDTIKEDNRDKIIITHYQFFSLILNNNLNILNRWYLWDNNTHPTETHKYFSFYKKMINKNLSKNKIKVIYLLGAEIQFEKVKDYFTDTCFKSTKVVENKFSYHEIIKCKV